MARVLEPDPHNFFGSRINGNTFQEPVLDSLESTPHNFFGSRINGNAHRKRRIMHIAQTHNFFGSRINGNGQGLDQESSEPPLTTSSEVELMETLP